MLDTMTFTKVVGGLCGALLVFLLGKWVAEGIYHVGGHGDDYAAAYVIETDDDEGDAAPAEELDFAAMLASADLGKGERVFGKCRACHKIEDGENATGPHLYGVVGRAIDGVDGFAYSGALEESAEVWTAENLNAFLENPRAWAPGTSMGFAGLRKPDERANLIAWLDSLDD